MSVIGVCGAQLTGVKRGSRNGAGIFTGTQELPDLIASRVLTHLIDRHGVAAPMNLKSDLTTFRNRYFLGREMVDKVGTGVGGTTNCPGLQAWQWADRRCRQHAEIHKCGSSTGLSMRQIALLSPGYKG